LAHDGKADAVVVAAAEPELRERDVELGLPALRVAADHDVPHRVPAVVRAVVVEPVRVLLHAGRVDRELVRGAPIVIGVDEDANPVRGGPHVAPREEADDLVGLRVERAHGNVDGRAVDDDAGLRPERRRRRGPSSPNSAAAPPRAPGGTRPFGGLAVPHPARVSCPWPGTAVRKPRVGAVPAPPVVWEMPRATGGAASTESNAASPTRH